MEPLGNDFATGYSDCLGNDFATGYSDCEKAQVPVYYGSEGPGPLYRREHFVADAEAEESPIHLDSGELDLWNFG